MLQTTEHQALQARLQRLQVKSGDVLVLTVPRLSSDTETFLARLHESLDACGITGVLLIELDDGMTLQDLTDEQMAAEGWQRIPPREDPHATPAQG